MDSGGLIRPKPRTTFQEELAAKMKDRRSRGLAADITPSPSVYDDSDDDGLGSDDELLTQFGLTSKKNSKPTQEMPNSGRSKSPWRPGEKTPETKRKQSTADDTIFGKKKNDEHQEPMPSSRNQRKKTSEDIIFGRKTPTNEDGYGRKTPTNDDFRGRKTPTNYDKSPSPYQQEAPTNQFWTPPSMRSSQPKIERKDSESRKTPVDESPRDQPHPAPRRRNKHTDDESDDSPRPKPRTPQRGKSKDVEKEVEKPKPRRKTPTTDIFGSVRKSPAPQSDSDEEVKQTFRGRKSPAPGRKTPNSRSNTPKVDNDTKANNKSPALRRKSSVMDVIESENVVKPKPRGRKQPSKHDNSESEEEAHRNPYGSEARKSPFRPRSRGFMGEEPRENSREEQEDDRPRPRSRKAHKQDERESSICREVEKDPMMVERAKEEKPVVNIKQKPQTKEHHELDDLIDRISAAQEDDDAVANTMRYIQPDKQNKEKQVTKRPTSATPKRKPQPRYASEPVSPMSTARSDASFESTDGIRQAVYDEWYRKKCERIRKEKQEKAKKKEEEEKHKKKEAEDKKLEAEATYRSWLSTKKDSVDIDYRAKKKKEEKDKKKEEEEKLEKKKDAELTYKSWKENKDDKLRQTLRKTHKEKSNLEKTEVEDKKKKQKDAAKFYEGWKNKKDEDLKKKARDERKNKKENEKLMETKKIEQEKDADNLYEEWIKKKEEQIKREKTEKRRKKRYEMENPTPAWSPASKTIPTGR